MDVIVVGGGPAGLLAAARCAQAGLDVLLLEEHPTIGEPVHCTGIVSLEIAELVKVPQEIILKRLRLARVVGPSGVACDIGWEGPEREDILAIDRAAFDRGLAKQAIEAGVTVRTGVRVDGVAPEHRAVTFRTTAGTLRARACVLACGVTYRFQRQLGLGLPGRVLHTAQVEVDAAPSVGVELRFGLDVAPEGFAWAVPISRAAAAPRGARNRLKIGVLCAGDAGARLAGLLGRPEIRQRLDGDPDPVSRRLLPVGTIAKTYANRILAVGDAGGFTKPMTGGGIFYSLLTASLAAETLIEGFQHGRLDEGFLAAYEARWKQRLGRELRVAGALRRLLCRLTDEEIDSLIPLVARDDVQSLIRHAARFNWHSDLILATLRQPRVAHALFRLLIR